MKKPNLKYFIILMTFFSCSFNNNNNNNIQDSTVTAVNKQITNPKVAAAMQFITNQLSPIDVNDKATIVFDKEYSYDYTGKISGKIITNDDIDRDNLIVVQYSITDHPYKLNTIPLSGDGHFSFQKAQPGAKRVTLVNAKTNEVYAETTSSLGLIRSYLLYPDDPESNTIFKNFCFSYDMAMALGAAIVTDQQILADKLAQGLLLMQSKLPEFKGAFYFSTNSIAPNSASPVFYHGAHAVCTYSLLLYIQSYQYRIDMSNYFKAVHDALNFTEQLYVKDGFQGGLYRGGYGKYLNNNYQPYNIPWVSSEHSFDIWHVFNKAYEVIGEKKYNKKANNLKNTILEKLWNPQTNRFYQGLGMEKADTADALDTNSWGAIWLTSVAEKEKSLKVLKRIDAYKHSDPSGVVGYRAYCGSECGYQDTISNIWLEGSFGVIVAFFVNKLDKYESLLSSLETLQHNDGSFDYVTITNEKHQMKKAKSIASTAWYVISKTNKGRKIWWNDTTP